MKLLINTLIAASIMCGVAAHATVRPSQTDVLAVKYHCDEGKTFSVNYVLGSQVARFDGKAWSNIEIIDTTARRDGDVVDGVQQTEDIPATQYTFENNGTRLYFITAKGRTSTGGLLLPNSDDMLFCEAQR